MVTIAICRRCGSTSSKNCAVVAPWHQSGAARSVLVSGLLPVMWCVPPPTHRDLVAAQHWPPCAGLPVCPPRGHPQPARLCFWIFYKFGIWRNCRSSQPSACQFGPQLQTPGPAVAKKPLFIAFTRYPSLAA